MLSRLKPYFCDENEKTDITINIPKEFYVEKQKLNPHMTLGECESLWSGAYFYEKITAFGGVMLHASCVEYEGKAYLFSARSGTGKSTHTHLWLKYLPGSRIINDDKPAIRYEDGKLYAYGTPFSGKHDLSANKRAEVAGICFLERALENSIEQISPKQSVHLMLEQTIRSNEIEFMDKLLFVMDKLLTSVKVYKLYCNMDISAARLAYETMSNTGE